MLHPFHVKESTNSIRSFDVVGKKNSACRQLIALGGPNHPNVQVSGPRHCAYNVFFDLSKACFRKLTQHGCKDFQVADPKKIEVRAALRWSELPTAIK